MLLRGAGVGSVRADPVGIAFSVVGGDGIHLPAGTLITGSLTFSPSTPASSSTPTEVVYEGAVISGTYAANGQTWNLDPLGLNPMIVYNGTSDYVYFVFSVFGTTVTVGTQTWLPYQFVLQVFRRRRQHL